MEGYIKLNLQATISGGEISKAKVGVVRSSFAENTNDLTYLLAALHPIISQSLNDMLYWDEGTWDNYNWQ